MKKAKINYEAINQALAVAKQHFPEGSFKIFWNGENELWLCFKEGVDELAVNVFDSMFRLCVPGTPAELKIIDANSGFWK